jgi:nucleoside-diphosphate-sugar epimerase
MASRSVFLVGAGYIGQNILDELLAAKYSVKILIRRPEQASVFEKAGAKTVVGTLSDLELLTAQTAQHQITINTSSSDDLPSVEAILAGVRQRVQAGLQSIFIHTGGTGTLEDGANGMHKNDKIYRDDNPADIDAISPASMHRHVDIPIRDAAHDLGDKAKIVIILPPLVYGTNSAHNRHSFAQTGLVRFALKHGFSGYVGEGRNLWSVIHVKDLALAYMTLLAYVEKSATSTFQENPYFFAENGSEISNRESAEHIGQILYDMGKIQNSKARTFAESDYADVFGPMTPRGFGCNSRSCGIRLRDLGWEPKEKDIWTSWKEEEIPAIVATLESASG